MDLKHFLNNEAEMSVIGNMILFPKETILPVAAILNPEDFQITEHQNIFSQLVEMYDTREPIDSTTIVSKLPKEYRSIIFEACEYSPNKSNFLEHARIVKEASKRYKAYNLTYELQSLLANPTGIEDSISKSEQILKSLNENKRSETVDTKKGILDFYTRHQCPLDPERFIKLGFNGIDKHLTLERGDYIVFGGRPSTGKTAFTLQSAYNMSLKEKVGYFSLETKPDKLTDRIIACAGGIELDNIKKNELTQKQWNTVSTITDDYLSRNLEIIKASGMTVNEIKNITVQNGYTVIFIDYMQLIHTNQSKEYDAVTEISRKLHELAQIENVLVVALSQLKREEKGRPNLQSLRSSGQIEQDVDVALFLWNDPDDDTDEDGRAEISRKLITIAKNKEGITGDKPMLFKGSIMRFYEPELRF